MTDGPARDSLAVRCNYVARAARAGVNAMANDPEDERMNVCPIDGAAVPMLVVVAEGLMAKKLRALICGNTTRVTGLDYVVLDEDASTDQGLN